MKRLWRWSRTTFAAATKATVSLFIAAAFWYVLLVVLGTAAASSGVAIQYGRGYGLMVLGILCLVGSELVRGGMKRA